MKHENHSVIPKDEEVDGGMWLFKWLFFHPLRTLMPLLLFTRRVWVYPDISWYTLLVKEKEKKKILKLKVDSVPLIEVTLSVWMQLNLGWKRVNWVGWVKKLEEEPLSSYVYIYICVCVCVVTSESIYLIHYTIKVYLMDEE